MLKLLCTPSLSAAVVSCLALNVLHKLVLQKLWRFVLSFRKKPGIIKVFTRQSPS